MTARTATKAGEQPAVIPSERTPEEITATVEKTLAEARAADAKAAESLAAARSYDAAST